MFANPGAALNGCFCGCPHNKGSLLVGSSLISSSSKSGPLARKPSNLGVPTWHSGLRRSFALRTSGQSQARLCNREYESLRMYIYIYIYLYTCYIIRIYTYTHVYGSCFIHQTSPNTTLALDQICFCIHVTGSWLLKATTYSNPEPEQKLTSPRGSKYPKFTVSGPKNHTLNGFWDH